VSKRLGSHYRSCRSRHWIKSKNSQYPAVKREAEEGLGTMTHHEDLVEADRLVADCMDRIARQREVIATRYEQGLPVDVAESMLRALEESLRAVEKHRQFIIERLKTWSRPEHPRIPVGGML
jgi:hypothetical protein